MNDDELVARLRATLQERADHFTPSPGSLPGAPGATAGAPGGGDDDIRFLTAPVPIVSARRRRTVLAGGAAALAVAAAVVLGVVLGQHPHPRTLQPAGPAPTTAAPAPAPTKTVPVVVSPKPTTPVTTPVTTPPTTQPPQPVPAGFVSYSATFVSPDRGWALGLVPCGGSGYCASVASTTDGGVNWASAGAPGFAITPVAGQIPQGQFEIRFADGSDGWIYTDPGNDPRMWSTHDGGLSWKEGPVPGDGGRIDDLEASAGVFHLVSGSSIWTTDAGSDAWTQSATTLDTGAGPVPHASIDLFGPAGWIIENNRTVVGGAELTSGGWTAWTPPCTRANGTGLLASASPTDLLALCNEGTWGTPDTGTTAGRLYLYLSSDGGATFQQVGALPASYSAEGLDSLTEAPGNPSTVVAAGSGGLVASFDGGVTWANVYTAGGSGSVNASWVGFTTATQGVAVLQGPTGSTLLMTRDGGHTWNPANP